MSEDKITEFDIRKKYIDGAEALGKEKRQEILAMIKKGKTLGEVSRYFNVELMIVAEILTQNIEHASFLRSEAL